MIYKIPGSDGLEIKTIILDLNGTLAVGGKIVEGVKPRLAKLSELGFNIIFFTGNTRGDAGDIASELGINWVEAKTGTDKMNQAQKLEPSTCASIGNGLIDLELMQTVGLGIVTLQAEGIHTKTMLACDIVVPTVNDALDLFIDESRLIATLRR